VAEAALCGKPSVVAGNSGLAEAVQDQCTGFVVPENDPASTANAIRKLLEDREIRQRMGEEARQRALAEQTWNVCMDRYHQAINQLMAKMG
jgi:glycosyltransferase involved in cell wall biosynthesis